MAVGRHRVCHLQHYQRKVMISRQLIILQRLIRKFTILRTSIRYQTSISLLNAVLKSLSAYRVLTQIEAS